MVYLLINFDKHGFLVLLVSEMLLTTVSCQTRQTIKAKFLDTIQMQITLIHC